MPSVNRLDRVNELYKRVIAEMLERGDLINNHSTLVSVTEVKAAVDLRNATVFVSVYGGTAAKAELIISQLNKFRHEIQHGLARELQMKNTPVLKFKLDKRLAAADSVLSMLDDNEEATVEEKEDARGDD